MRGKYASQNMSRHQKMKKLWGKGQTSKKIAALLLVLVPFKTLGQFNIFSLFAPLLVLWWSFVCFLYFKTENRYMYSSVDLVSRKVMSKCRGAQWKKPVLLGIFVNTCQFSKVYTMYRGLLLQCSMVACLVTKRESWNTITLAETKMKRVTDFYWIS